MNCCFQFRWQRRGNHFFSPNFILLNSPKFIFLPWIPRLLLVLPYSCAFCSRKPSTYSSCEVLQALWKWWKLNNKRQRKGWGGELPAAFAELIWLKECFTVTASGIDLEGPKRKEKTNNKTENRKGNIRKWIDKGQCPPFSKDLTWRHSKCWMVLKAVTFSAVIRWVLESKLHYFHSCTVFTVFCVGFSFFFLIFNV